MLGVGAHVADRFPERVCSPEQTSCMLAPTLIGRHTSQCLQGGS